MWEREYVHWNRPGFSEAKLTILNIIVRKKKSDWTSNGGRRSTQQSIITKKNTSKTWFQTYTLTSEAIHLYECRGRTHTLKWVSSHTYSSSSESLVQDSFFFLIYCCLSLRNKMSGNPLSRWTITIARQSDFMAADWKMALCSNSIYIGKCWWFAIANAIVDEAALPVVFPWHLIVVHIQLCIMH